MSRNITFYSMETGATFVKDGKTYTIRNMQLQNRQACKSGMSYEGKAICFNLVGGIALHIPKEEHYVRHFAKKCDNCFVCRRCNERALYWALQAGWALP